MRCYSSSLRAAHRAGHHRGRTTMAFFRSLTVAVVFLVTSPDSSSSFLVVTDHSMTRMVAFSGPGHSCSTSNDRKVIMRAVMSSHSHQMVRTESQEDMGALVDACKRHMENEITTNPTPGGFLFPGTKWCGPGSSAKNYEDLGAKRAEDMCCREHDNCPSFLSPGECRSGICNDSPFTRSECKCDQQFQKCLQRVRSSAADTIGALYFNVARIMCYNKDSTRCLVGSESCKLSIMPYYTSNGLRQFRDFIVQLIRGFFRFKHRLIFS